MSTPALPIWMQLSAPARQRQLDRTAIVRAAIAVADRRGSHALTMANVARQLGNVSAMALYRHVSSKDGLVDLMLDTAIAEVAFSSARDWRTNIRALARETWKMVQRHLWYAQLVHTRPPLGPNSMRRSEAMLRTFTAAGASIVEALTYVALIDRHIYGTALQAADEHAMRLRHGLKNMREFTKAITALHQLAAASGEFPLLARWMAEPSGPSLEEQFQLSLDFLIDGIAARLG